MTPMQKLVWPATTRAYLELGSALLAGPAVRMVDAAGWSTPADVLTAYGIDPAGVSSVDVMRFAPAPVSQVMTPESDSPTAIAGYATGFLRGAGGVVPVWDVAPTEVPQDAELWRIHADGAQELLSAYGGPAIGWRSTGVYAPPSMAIGPRAVWQGTEYFASWTDAAHVELVAYAESAPDGFEQTRPRVFRRVVAVSECARILELAYTALWNDDIACRIIQYAADRESAVLLKIDAAQAAAIGAVMLEPGVFWKVVPTAELTQIQGTTNELRIPR